MPHKAFSKVRRPRVRPVDGIGRQARRNDRFVQFEATAVVLSGGQDASPCRRGVVYFGLP